MKTPTINHWLYGIWVALFIMIPADAAYTAEGGVVETYKNATAPFDESKVDAALSLPIPSVLVTERYQGGRFWQRVAPPVLLHLSQKR